MKKAVSLILSCALTVFLGAPARAGGTSPVYLPEDDTASVPASVFREETPAVTLDAVKISAPSAILVEKETGRVLYEKNADEKLEPASVTKVMTLLLIVEAIDAGKIALENQVSTSAYAASMGGSQIFLEEGETLSVRDMLKSIVVASANDCAVAMAETISGSETVFVAKMNERAQQLGMTNTTFTNCTGLLDDKTHVTTARDIAIMSRELIRHDMIKTFTKIWMDTVRDGAFGLNNTNKLIYYYPGATGLKTGFTSRSMYCLSATAERDGVEYIAVILHGETSASRFEDAKTLLSFAFANYALLTAAPGGAFVPVRVTLGKPAYVQPVLQGAAKLLVEKDLAPAVTKNVELAEKIDAPVEAGDRLGLLTVKSGGTVLGAYPIVAGDSVEKRTWGDIFIGFLKMMFAGGL